jgi:hypothetical protein
MLSSLKVLRKHLNAVLDHPMQDSKLGRERLEENLKNAGITKADIDKVGKALFDINYKLRKGDERLLKVIFGVEEIEDDEDEDESEDVCNCEECDFKEDCDKSTASEDYKARVGKEYWELVEKSKKLKDKIEAILNGEADSNFPSVFLLTKQHRIMESYIETLEKRAVVENIELGKYKENK